ncbi:MAG: lysine--tRNA ligase [Kofleriaceae bacterium]|nr:lysine--tRNA ligase [Myxococcales bacterium]MCB9565467.1 lysine--tRNA ligase [Kofleriaceae bacterium]MCB9573205.1 lysine--tRNA ligase [Kofleriaceae bacterium]
MASDDPRPDDDHSTLARIIGERKSKAAALRAGGRDPYRNDVRPTHDLATVRARYEPTRPAADAPVDKGAPITPVDGEVVRVAGRCMARRGFGKTVFVPIRDGSAELQLYLNVEHLDAADFAEVLPQLDVGDVVAAEGTAFWTKRGELSILATRLWILTKSQRPLPDKWHGMTDLELRYRQRYVDLAVSPEVREVFRKRSLIVRGIRRYLDARGFLEVETPMMHPIIGGAAARPFVTHHNALDMQLYMRIAPELYLKRLVVGGFDRVYEINRNFRNEGLSRRHNPEFTMLELYQAYATWHDLMDLTEELFAELAQEINGTTSVTWDGVEVSLGRPWQRVSVRDAVHRLGGVAEADTATLFDDPAAGFELALRHGVDARDALTAVLEGVADMTGLEPAALLAEVRGGRASDVARRLVERYPSRDEARIRAGHLGFLVFEATAEAKLVQPTFLTDFPLAVSPLARKSDADPAFCDRFELFVCGKEIANGFSELNDPEDQRERFQAQLRARAAGAAETMDYDEDYCRALEIGLPPTAGEGVGIDRLAMLLTGQASIRDVILFPLMRPET